MSIKSTYSSLPLCVDLDGTFIKEDVTRLTLKEFTRGRPWRWLQVFGWFIWGSCKKSGKAYVKEKVLDYVSVDTTCLTFTPQLWAYLHAEQEKGRSLILATGAHYKAAQQAVQHIGLFDDIIATEQGYNCIGAAKAALLVNKFGEKGFVYAGNSTQDLDVWPHSAEVIAVNCPPALLQTIQEKFKQSITVFDKQQ